MYLTQALKRAVQINGKQIATQDGDRVRTWSDCIERISKLAGAMEKLGFSDNDRSAILSLNSDRYFEALYAAVWAGGIFVPINTRLAPPEIEFWLNVENRIHERLKYSKDKNGDWKKLLLNP